MAYKFQRGSFTASGSINVEDALTGSGTVTLGNAAADLVSVVGNASFDNDVTLGNAQSDVTTVTGQLTASHGALFSNDISIPAARVLYLSGKGGQNKLGCNGGTNLSIAVQNDLTLNAGGSGFLPETTSASYIGLPSKAWLGASIHALTASYIGSASLAGALDANSQNITSIGSSLTFAGDAGIDMTSAATENAYINMGDNLAIAFDITQDANSYLKFTTTNNLESMTAGVTLSGSIFSGSAVGAFVGDGSSLTNISMDSMDLTRGYVWIGDSDGEAAAVDAKTSGQILVGDGTDVNSVAVSGDVTISSAGAVTIANNAVETAMILSGAVSSVKIGDQQLIQRNFGTGSVEANAIKQGAVTMAAIATGSIENNAYATGSIQANHIKQGAVTMAAMATGSVENNAYATGSVENAHLAGSIANAKLANSSFTIGDSTISLGGTDTTLTGLTGLDMTAADATIFATVAANTLTLGAATTSIAIAGELEVAQSILYSGVSVLGAGSNQVLTSTSSYIVVSGSSAVSIALPSAPDEGSWFSIKRSSDMTGGAVKLDYNSGKTIDGDQEIALETAGAAVTLLYDGTTDMWNIF